MANYGNFIVNGNEKGDHYCWICNSYFDKYCSIEAHFNDEYHSEALKSYSSLVPDKANSAYYCTQCNLKIYSGAEVSRHSAGNLHSSSSKIIDWKFLKSFICPFVVSISRNSRTVYICAICNCIISNEASSFDEHMRGSHHSRVMDEQGTYILPLENDRFYCICCDFVIDAYRAIYSHTKEENHSSNLRRNAKERVRRPTSWKAFVCPFVVKEGPAEYYCMICDYWMMSQTNFLIHAADANHTLAVKLAEPHFIPLEDNYYHCKLCDVVIYDCKNVRAHLRGHTHRGFVPPPIDRHEKQKLCSPFVRSTEEKKFYCVICDETIETLASLYNHVNGNSHADAVTCDGDYLLPLEAGRYQCTICNIVIYDDRKIRSHLFGMRHNAALTRIRRFETPLAPGLERAKVVDWSCKEYCEKPFVSRENGNEFYCMLCNCYVMSRKAVDTHAQSALHIVGLEQQGSLISPLNNFFYYCCLCDFFIVHHKLIYKHLRSERHHSLFATMISEEGIDGPKAQEETPIVPSSNNESNGGNTSLRCNGENRREEKIEGKETSSMDADKKRDSDVAAQVSTDEMPIDGRSNISDRGKSPRKEDNQPSPRRRKEEEEDSENDSNLNIGFRMIFPIIKRELAALYSQLGLIKGQQVGAGTEGAIASWLQKFTEKLPADKLAFTRVEYLTGLMKFLCDNIKVHLNASAKVGHFSKLTKSRLSKKILDFLEDQKKHLTEMEEMTERNIKPVITESIDSGNEEPAQPKWESITDTGNVEKQHPPSQRYLERVSKLLNFNEDIYDTSEKTRKMLLGMNLRFVINSKSDYCLVCRIIVPSSLEKCLEHLSDEEHTKHLENMEEDHENFFPSISGSFSELSLAHEYIEIVSEDKARCLVCREEMINEDPVLIQHYDDQNHRDSWEKMRSKAGRNVDLVASQIQCDWYNVQKYECLPCSRKFDFEIDFVEHLLENEKHSSNIENIGDKHERRIVYEFCAPCAVLSCTSSTVQTNHRDSITHKWFIEKGPFVSTRFPETARALLDSLEIENFHIVDIVEEIERDCRSSILEAYEKGTGHDHKLSLEAEPPVEDVKFIKFFNKICPSCVKIMSFLKQWLTECDLAGLHKISTIALYWYMILYFQTLSILPPIASLNSMKKFWHGLADQEDFPKLQHQSLSLKEHIIGFFTLYANFDYRYDVACPLLGKVIEKRAFTDDTHCLPEDMRSYVSYMRNTEYPEPFQIDSVMCLQDPFDLQNNLTKRVRKVDLSRFRIFCLDSLSVLCTPEN